MSRRGRTRQAAREETQRLLLEAGSELLAELPVGNVFSHIKAGDVARRAGLSTGALYHYWPDQSSFLTSLLDFYLRRQRTEAIGAITTALADVVAQGEPLEELIRIAGLKDFELAKESRVLTVELGLWAQRELEDDIAERVRAGYRDRDAQLVPLYQALLDAYQRTVRPPFTVEMLAAVISAVAEGLLIRWAIDREAIPDVVPAVDAADSGAHPPEEPPWNVFGLLLRALIPVLTAPCEDPGGQRPADVRLLPLEP